MSQTKKHCEPLVVVWLRPSTTEPCICCKQVAEKLRWEHLKNDVNLPSRGVGLLSVILSIRWQDKIPNTVVLERAGLPSIFMLLSQRRLCWLGHVRRMADGRIPKDLLYGELSRGARSRGRPRLCFKDTCKRDLKSASIDIQSWESLAESRDSWRAAVHCGTKKAEQDRTDHLKEKRAARKRSCSIDQAATFHTCRLCGKDCHSRIGLHSHTRRCSDQN